MINSKLIFLLAGLLGLCIVQAEVHSYDFVLEEKNFTRLCYTKSMLVVNGTYPGPTLYARRADILYVNVYNKGSFGVTIHWHGVKNPRNPWFDGPEYITQCAIPPGTNFTYQVILSEEEGTVWWHAHNEWTRWSVHGAIVVYPAEGTTYPFPQPDGEKVLVLASWYNENVRETIAEKYKEGVDLGVSDAYAINGELGDLSPCPTDTAHRWKVESGKTYLLRLVNGAMNAELFFAIANHTVTVVGTDGAYLKPFETAYVVISPGQTMDMLVTASQSPGQYFIAARQYYTDKLIFLEFNHFNATAILEYDGNYTAEAPVFPSALPFYYDSKSSVEFDDKLRSLATEEYPIDVPMNITTRMFITASVNEFIYQYENGTDGTAESTSVNNISWANPSMDVLIAYYKNLSGYYTADFPDKPPRFFDFTSYSLPIETTAVPEVGTRVKVLDYNEEVEIVFQGTNVLNSSENHPMHLHGHSFYVVGSGIGNFDNGSDPLTYNLVDPPYQNTATLPKNGWLVIRFRANNPGVWLWHCHLDKHLTWGMNSVIIVKDGGTEETTIRDPPAYMPSCAATHYIHDFSGSDEKLYHRTM